MAIIKVLFRLSFAMLLQQFCAVPFVSPMTFRSGLTKETPAFDHFSTSYSMFRPICVYDFNSIGNLSYGHFYWDINILKFKFYIIYSVILYSNFQRKYEIFFFFSVTIVSGLIMFILFVSELNYYMTTEVTKAII